ncbi:MAG TPA: HD domain-containing protein [Streptosporangiaceae bacterium]|nr:HD domain-containing protein [Streptosporangiaceae bacterium]
MPERSASAPLLTSRFQHAFTLASQIHATQVRKGTAIPYLAHLMSVAALVLEHGGGEDAAIAALLHDAIEDSDDGAATEMRIRSELGARVAAIVAACSDAVGEPGRPKPPWRDRKQAYLRRLAAEDDPDVLLVSACDKLHNARSIAADLRDAGPAVWQRFSQPDPALQIGYYQSLAGCYAGRVPDRLAGELSRVISQIESLAAGTNATEV